MIFGKLQTYFVEMSRRKKAYAKAAIRNTTNRCISTKFKKKKQQLL